MSRLPAVGLAPALALGFLLTGLLARLLGHPALATGVWLAGLYVVGLPVVLRTAAGVLKRRFAADLVATLAILAAMILVQPFAGLVIALMQTGGETLEGLAERRATRAVEELEALAPRIAHLQVDGRTVDVGVDRVRVGDVFLVRPGEMVPCDATILEGEAGMDIARITGEPVPLPGRPGVEVRSGTLVLDGPLVLRADARASDSLYAQVVEQVRVAQARKAPLQRLADRVAVWFTPATLAVCALAWWLSGDPNRVLAVLVVATPCPLILATPVAIIGGINRAARQRIIVRHGGALEALASVEVAVFDKTGTLTVGQPEVASVESVGGFADRELLALAASVEHGAGHPLARSVVRAAEGAGLALAGAVGVTEVPGRGVRGTVTGRRVTVGALSLVRELEPGAADALEAGRGGRSGLHAYVAVDGAAAGVVTFADRARPETADALRDLRALGLERQVILSGDHPDAVAALARSVGLVEIAGNLLPGDKVAYIERLRREGHRVLMVGDGINDAPALSAATVGVALAEHGGGIAAESADVVLLEDNLRLAGAAVVIARRTMRIARQSLVVGLGLSLAAMAVAAFGYIPPAAGAVLQEGIDLAVIANALRAAQGPAGAGTAAG